MRAQAGGLTPRRVCARPALAAVLALAGCALAPAPPELRHIEGRLDAPAPGLLATPAEWVVELRDDDADRVLAEQRGPLPPASAPIAFALTVDAARVVAAHRHSVRGAVRERGLVQWLSEPRAVDLRHEHADVGSLRLRPFPHPGGFASVLDCGGRRLVAGYLGERLRLVDGDRVLELQPVHGSQPLRFESAAEPSTFVQWHDHGATVSLAGQRLPRCVAQPLR